MHAYLCEPFVCFKVVPTEPASSGDSMVYPLWWLHSTTSSPSSGALNNVSSANSATR